MLFRSQHLRPLSVGAGVYLCFEDAAPEDLGLRIVVGDPSSSPVALGGDRRLQLFTPSYHRIRLGSAPSRWATQEGFTCRRKRRRRRRRRRRKRRRRGRRSTIINKRTEIWVFFFLKIVASSGEIQKM